MKDLLLAITLSDANLMCEATSAVEAWKILSESHPKIAAAFERHRKTWSFPAMNNPANRRIDFHLKDKYELTVQGRNVESSFVTLPIAIKKYRFDPSREEVLRDIAEFSKGHPLYQFQNSADVMEEMELFFFKEQRGRRVLINQFLEELVLELPIKKTKVICTRARACKC